MNKNGTGLRVPIFQEIRFDDNDYASLRLRLDMYDDMVVATKYEDGQEHGHFVVDPVDVAQKLADFPVSSKLLPANALFWGRKDGRERIGLWLPPSSRTLEIHLNDWPELTVPLPGLVLVGHGTKYYLWAVKGDERPEEKSILYQAPLPNVSSQGVCAGSVQFPEASAATIEQAARLYLESGFNNHLADGKSQKYGDNILRMWRVLDRAGACGYPAGDLVPTRRRLGDICNG